MPGINNLINDLIHKLTEIKYDIGPFVSENNICTDNISNSENFHENLMIVYRALRDCVGIVEAKIKYSRERYKQQVPALQDLLEKIHAGKIEAGRVIETETKNELCEPPENLQIVEQRIPYKTSEHVLIPMTPSPLEFSAIPVSKIEDVRPDGNIYYHSRSNHFAFYLGGFLFHGNIGNIHISEKEPHKIHPCRFGNKCTKSGKCTYYHDPFVTQNSRDIRNYTRNSFTYQQGHAFGNRNTLAADLNEMDDITNVNKYYDMATHFMISAILLKQKKSNNIL